MSFLDDVLIFDAANVFASADLDFEIESIVYKPHGGSSRTFPAPVRRFPQEQDEAGNLVDHIEVFCPYSTVATEGITSVDRRGRDKITIATKRGGTPVDHPVVEIIDSDAGGFMILLR